MTATRQWGDDPVMDKVDGILARAFLHAHPGLPPVHDDDLPDPDERYEDEEAGS